jgi:signal transduction histidine kinase
MMMDNDSNAELARANDVIGQFITSCSHSLRGPAKSIEGLVNLMLNNRNYTDQEQRMFLDLIVRSSIKMENMLDALEHFLENSRREIICRSINLQEITESTLKPYQYQVEKKGIQMNVVIDQPHPLLSDPSRLRIVLSNLIDNAIHFQDNHKQLKMIDVSVKGGTSDIYVSVADNGIGIDPAADKKIFDLFFRASEKSGGSGIGLYVVKEILAKMNGKIKVKSKPGVGTKFILCIPALSAQ